MLRRPPKGVRLQSMNDEPVVEPFAKPAVDRKYLLTMNRCDAWTLLDWSAHPTAKLADLLGLQKVWVSIEGFCYPMRSGY